MAVIVCGCWALFVGNGSLSMGAELSFVGGGAHLHGQVIHGCWFVICGHSGDVSYLAVTVSEST